MKHDARYRNPAREVSRLISEEPSNHAASSYCFSPIMGPAFLLFELLLEGLLARLPRFFAARRLPSRLKAEPSVHSDTFPSCPPYDEKPLHPRPTPSHTQQYALKFARFGQRRGSPILSSRLQLLHHDAGHQNPNGGDHG
eukprot:GEZU01015285.1.p1 GENE.GEZU01015285.1~~GEZU01015285.1.p1  ORF type:complete len:140 (-),score=6.63 GEZU01015285.1:138-557(-)